MALEKNGEEFQYNFTQHANLVLKRAEAQAAKLHDDHVGIAHVMLGLLMVHEGMAYRTLMQLGLNERQLIFELNLRDSGSSLMQDIGKIIFDKETGELLASAAQEAEDMNFTFIGTEHLLLAILKNTDSQVCMLLQKQHITRSKVLLKLRENLDTDYLPAEEDDAADGIQDGGEQEEDDAAHPALNAFGRNLTALAAEGKLDPVIGRNFEIERIIQILCRRTKNNPVLIGEAGVGKTAILEGLAQAIVKKNVPDVLYDKQIYTIDLPLMVAGTKYRGQFEERLKDLVKEVCASKKIIIFIDELHTLVGAGSAEGSMDAANIIKPALSRGELQCVGATTVAEYRKIEKDAAMERRFQPIMVNPPSIEDSIKILQGIKSVYEKYHSVIYDDEAIEAAVLLSDRYITNRFLPDKAIDLLDEAGARVGISSAKKDVKLISLKEKLSKLQNRKRLAVEKQNFEEAMHLKEEEGALVSQIDNLQKNKVQTTAHVTVSHVAQVVAMLTGVPVHQVNSKSNKQLLLLAGNLRKRIIGQDNAVNTVASALKRSGADLRNPDRPIGSFIFIGPSGVGKTMFAKELARSLFGNTDALVQINMTEYVDRYNVSRLVGSPPGYVGYGEGGELTEKVRHNPYSVVLFDEIEKAHPDVMHILLQILDEGQITDTLGRKINFRNTVIILTSNAGAAELAGQGGMGFSNDEKDVEDKLRAKLLKVMKNKFKPEFLNRIDDIVVFNKLSNDSLLAILDMALEDLRRRVHKNCQVKLRFSSNVKPFLMSQLSKTDCGARNLQRLVERFVESPLADMLLTDECKSGSILDVRKSSADNSALEIRFVRQKNDK